MDKAGDLYEETENCIETKIINVSHIKEVAQTLKLKIRTFGDTLEESREYLEDLLKYFQIIERMDRTIDLPYKTRQEYVVELVNIAHKLQNEPLLEKTRVSIF